MDVHGYSTVCQGAVAHSFQTEEGFLTFSKPDPGKYNETYATQYAGLWAFGYETLHLGLDEPLYRTVSSLVAESLVRGKKDFQPVIVDCGCGVGRVTADCAELAPTGRILGFDGSYSMLALAKQIVCDRMPVDLALDQFGYNDISIQGRGLSNVFLARADVENLPLKDACTDIVLSINIVDRLIHGPEIALPECRRIIKTGGHIVFANPMNWTDSWLWSKYSNPGDLLALFRHSGFHIDTWFDRLIYREILDKRGATEEFPTLIVLGTAID